MHREQAMIEAPAPIIPGALFAKLDEATRRIYEALGLLNEDDENDDGANAEPLCNVTVDPGQPRR